MEYNFNEQSNSTSGNTSSTPAPEQPTVVEESPEARYKRERAERKAEADKQMKKMEREFKKLGKSTGKILASFGLLAALLSSYAEKTTEQGPNDNAPKSVLRIGTLGIPLVRAELSPNPGTDFSIQTIGAESMKEAAEQAAQMIGTDVKADDLYQKKPSKKVEKAIVDAAKHVINTFSRE